MDLVVVELPDTVVRIAAARMFLVGAVVLLREARTHVEHEREKEDFAARAGQAGFRWS